ncbi:MAG: methyltransferase, FxLD system, partial [Pseudonocardiaceae bacterium]
DALRAELVDKLIAQRAELNAVLSSEVEAALGTVPRHLFAPGVSLEKAYANDTVITKRDEHGSSLSSVSAPWLQAMMLEQAQIRPGMRILEIGSGGYNAALIAELVGEEGEVTTVDIDPEVVDRARRCLGKAGYHRVTVVLADAEGGVPGHAPYDRIIVTVGAWDIPPAWVDQLAEGGRLVVPLRIRGLTRSVVFEREDAHLVSRAYELCGFVPMQGAGECREQLVLLDGETVGLRLDDEQQVYAGLLRAALSQSRMQAWSGVTAGRGDRFDGLHLWLALVLPGFGLLKVQQEAVDRGIVAHSWPLGIPTAVDGGNLAYLALRPVNPERQRSEFGVYAHGPDAGELADRMVRHIQSWDGTSLSARIEAHPAGTPDDQLPESALVLDKKHTRVTISWPQAATAAAGQGVLQHPTE